MAVTTAAIAANQASGNPAKRVGAYMKAHWKELLALVLAAIPALFIIFHTGARKTAQQILTLAPASSVSPPAPPAPPVPPTDQTVGGAFPTARDTTNQSPSNQSPLARLRGRLAGSGAIDATNQTSVNGSNPTRVAAPSLSSAAGFPPARDLTRQSR